jgi:4-amino-4-deoxy-L-arabinose transferase-like glycosyltransferase
MRVLGLAAVAVGAALLLGAGLASAPLLDPDEARHAEIAREMFESGQLLAPVLNGAPYHHKPSFFYTLVGLAYRIGGVGEASARVVPALSAWLTLIAVYWYGSRTSMSVGLLATLLLGSCAFFIGVGRFTNFDALVTATFSGAMLSLAVWLDEPDRRARLVVAYGLLALAVLSKGPAAAVLGAIPLPVAWWLGDLRLKAFWSPVGLALFVSIVAAWAVPAALYAPDYLYDFLMIHNLQRYLVPTRGFHSEPIYFFVPVLACALLPWSPLVPASLRWALRSHASDRFLALHALGVIVFFSLSEGKLATYVLPAFPALALVVARWAVSGVERPVPSWAIRLAAWLFLPLPLIVWVVVRWHAPDDAWIAVAFLPVAIAAGLVQTIGSARWTPLAGLCLVCGGMITTVVTFNVTAGAALGRFASDRDLAALAERVHPERPVVAVGVKPYSFLFYTRQRVVYGGDDSEWSDVLASGEAALILSKEQRVVKVEQAFPDLATREIGRNARHMLLAVP